MRARQQFPAIPGGKQICNRHTFCRNWEALNSEMHAEKNNGEINGFNQTNQIIESQDSFSSIESKHRKAFLVTSPSTDFRYQSLEGIYYVNDKRKIGTVVYFNIKVICIKKICFLDFSSASSPNSDSNSNVSTMTNSETHSMSDETKKKTESFRSRIIKNINAEWTLPGSLGRAFRRNRSPQKMSKNETRV